MNNFFNPSAYKTVHLIGIGGISMSAIAKYLICLGVQVTGSDKTPSNITSDLQAKGAKIYYSHNKNNVKGANAVIYSSALSENCPELKMARKLNLPIFKRSQALNAILSCYNMQIGVSGSHGKTTTTNMIATVLTSAGLNPTVFLGGETLSYSNFRFSNSNIAVAEVCEYQKNINDIKCKISVILNIDNDHQESYNGIYDQVNTFSAFAKNSFAVINADDKYSKKIVADNKLSYGLKKDATLRAKYIKKGQKGYSFTAYYSGERLGVIRLPLDGKHNVYNALASLAVCLYLGVTFKQFKKGIEGVESVARRNEKLGELDNKPVYADYAHHPTEIKQTLQSYFDDFLVIFQPHTYSRTKALMDEFISVLSLVSKLIIYKTYPAREKLDKSADAKTLYKNLRGKGNNALYYAKNKKELKKIISRQIDKVKGIVAIGAGDIYYIVKSLIKNAKC